MIFSISIACFIVAQVVDYAIIGIKEVIIGLFVTVIDTAILIWLRILNYGSQ